MDFRCMLIILIGFLSACLALDKVELRCGDGNTKVDTQCAVANLMVSQGQTVVLPKTQQVYTVKFLSFYSSRLIYIPLRLFEVFSGVLSFEASNTGIIVLSHGTFSGATNLSVVNLSHNNLTELGTGAFIGAGNLMRIDLSFNKLSVLKDNSFAGLDMINRIILSNNELISIEANAFETNIYLDMINLSGNKLTDIHPDVFNRLQHLHEIDFANNLLVTLHPHTFRSALNLESLKLSANSLNEFQMVDQKVNSLLMVDRNNLTKLHIVRGTKLVHANHNQITHLEFEDPTYLETLIISYNNISAMVNITHLTSLLELDLSYNPIAPLNISTFDRLTRLRRLFLSGIGLESLTFGMFSKQLNLEVIDLSYNKLTELNIDMFVPYFYKLNEFYVDGNNLTEIKGKLDWMAVFPNLRKLGLSLNRFNCTYLHMLLTPPILLARVTLHIEPDNRNEEMSHIRDISCVSDVRQSLHMAEKELRDMNKLQHMLNISLATMHAHEGQLETSVILLKTAMVLMVIGVLIILTVFGLQMWRKRHAPVKTYFVRSIEAPNIAEAGSETTFHLNPNSVLD